MDSAYRPIEVFRRAAQCGGAGQRFVAALVLAAEGSTPQQAGARAVIDAAGQIFGTLGGGWVEAESQRLASEVCHAQQPRVAEFHLDNNGDADAGPICGGTMRILLDPIAAGHRSCYAAAAEALEQRRRGVLLTTVQTAATAVTMQWLPEAAIAAHDAFPGGEAIGVCLTRETPRLFGSGQSDTAASAKGTVPFSLRENWDSPQEVEVFVEPVAAQPLLLIAGAGHVGRALAMQAVQLGFDVTVVDDRPELASPALFPAGVTVRCGQIPAQMAALAGEPESYIVIVTRGHQHDGETLAACIHAPARYIGMIGSRRKVRMMREDLLRRGLATQAELDRICAPIGLEIGAVTVPEIAVSIAAELIAVRRRRSGGTVPIFAAGRHKNGTVPFRVPVDTKSGTDPSGR